MWYFAWILGIGLAVAFGVLNGVWHEFHLFDDGDLGLGEPDRESGETAARVAIAPQAAPDVEASGLRG